MKITIRVKNTFYQFIYCFTTLYASSALWMLSNFDYLESYVLSFSMAFVPKEPSACASDFPISVADDAISKLSFPISNPCHTIVTVVLYSSKFSLVAYNVNYHIVRRAVTWWNIIIAIVITNILWRETDQSLNHHLVKNQALGFSTTIAYWALDITQKKNK